MFNKPRLLTPGPTPIPERVRLVMAQDMIHHRKTAFQEAMARVQGHLRPLFGTDFPVLPLSCSGTGAMTAAVHGLFSRGEKVLVIEGGKFGERWRNIAATRGLTGRRERQGITISAPISFLNLWFAPRLRGFMADHPEVSVQLNSSIWTDPNSDLADIGFAFEKADLAAPEAAVLSHERLVPAGPPHLATLAALPEMPRIEVQGKYSLWDMWAEAMKLRPPSGQPVLRVDTAISALELAAAGAGLTVVYSTYAAGFSATGRIALPFGQGVAVPHVLTMTRNAKRKETAAARSFMAWAAGQFPAACGL